MTVLVSVLNRMEMHVIGVCLEDGGLTDGVVVLKNVLENDVQLWKRSSHRKRRAGEAN